MPLHLAHSLVTDPLSGMLWQGIQQPMVRCKDKPQKTPTKHDGSERLMGRQFLRKVDREAGAGWEMGQWLGKGEQEDGMRDAVRGA